MKTLNDLHNHFADLRKMVSRELPRELGNVMQREMEDNFKHEGYGNDGVMKPWPARNYEQFLNYPKLMYRGQMYRSIKLKTRVMGRGTAIVSLGSRDPVFRVHQLGGRTMPRGSHHGDRGWRCSPYASKTVNIAGREVPARPMIGFGARSRRWFKQVMDKEFSRLFRR